MSGLKFIVSPKAFFITQAKAYTCTSVYPLRVFIIYVQCIDESLLVFYSVFVHYIILVWTQMRLVKYMGSFACNIHLCMKYRHTHCILFVVYNISIVSTTGN